MKRTLLTYLYLVVAISVEIYAQIHYEPTIGLSPEVSRFSEFGDVPVSLYTGIPKIEIPLHEIKIGTHTIPIRLHYIGGGIKPDEHPGWLGLGWALKIGGCITRTVNGYPDEYYNPVTLGKVGYYYNFSSNVSSSDISNLDNCLLNVAKQAHDNAPDKFSFSFLDYNGNFYLSNTGEWVVQCDRPVKIIFDGTEDSFTRKYSETSTSFSLQGTNADLVGRSHHFKKFTIMGEDGTRYIFGGSDSAIEYNYDSNGNMISDLNRSICSVSYNELNLPQHISFTNGYAIDYIYDAIGRKLKTIYSIDYRTVFSPEELENLPEDEEAVEIILMREYCGRYTYSDGKIECIETDNGFINSTGNYNYYIKDYQGNIHITLQHDGTMLDRSMYYPYGSGFYDMNSRSGRFQFAGKELNKMQNLNMYYFGARFYDPSLGRFSTSDPLCERHYGVSPYLYCAGNPNKYNDPLGLDWISAQFDNHIFIFFDNRVESVDDITNNYGSDLENWTYLGDNGQIVIGSKMDGSTITIGLG